MQKTTYSDPAVEKIDNEVKELLEKQSMGYKLVAYVGRKSYIAKRVLGCGTEIWFTPRGRQWRRADRIEVVRPSVPQAEHTRESEDERPRNFRRTIRRPEGMDKMINGNTTTEEWLEDWDYYASQYE